MEQHRPLFLQQFFQPRDDTNVARARVQTMRLDARSFELVGQNAAAAETIHDGRPRLPIKAGDDLNEGPLRPAGVEISDAESNRRRGGHVNQGGDIEDGGAAS